MGTYHNLGYFLSSVTKLNRIVNIDNMKLGTPKKEKNDTILQVSFRASTFSAVPDAEMAKAPADAAKAPAGKK
jgi:Tfp pilus assembly protein PilO